MSLERKLPLLMAAVLVAILATAVALAYGEVRRVGEFSATERLTRASTQLAELAAASITRYERTVKGVTSSPAVREALEAPLSSLDSVHADSIRSAAARALRRLATPSDSNLAIQLWSADGAMVASIGGPVVIGAPASDATVSFPIPSTVGGGADSTADESARFGRFFRTRDGGIYYWITTPVIRKGHTIGWVAQQSRIAGRPDTDRQINGLVGEHSAVYFRNDTGSVWTTVGGKPVTRPTASPERALTDEAEPAHVTSYRHGGHGMVLASDAVVAGTPWSVVVETERSSVIAGARALLVRFGLFSVLLLALGAAACWFIIRRAMRPLTELTGAAALMASGDYSARVDTVRTGEIGRLSTAFNQMASEVEAAHAELAGQFEQAQRLAAELDEARVVALSGSRAKSNFLATISHEIRTPINAILGYTDILEMELHGPLTAKQHDSIDRIQKSTQHLLALVNEVLDLSKIESGTMVLRSAPGDTRQVVDAAVALVQPQATAAGIHISVDYGDAGSSTYVGDDRAVRQALANLLSNAVKFSDSAGEVVVSCSRSRTPHTADHPANGAPYIAISVSDSGIGIAEADLQRLFQPFTQLESEKTSPYKRARSGAGLGLSISRELAQLMNGDITVESTPGRGSTFTLWLPAEVGAVLPAVTV